MENSVMRRVLAVCVAFGMVVSLSRPLDAIMAYPPTDSVPVYRLIINATKYVKAHPTDSGGHYLLGRLHSLVFAGNTRTLEVWRWTRGYDPALSLPQVAFLEEVPRMERTVPGKVLPAEAREHLIESLRNYRRATELKPGQPLAFLGLGWMLEQGALFAEEVDAPFKNPPRRIAAQEWRAEALATYRYLAANSVSLVGSNPQPESPQEMLMEASQAILRLLPGPDLSPEEKAETGRARKAIESYQASSKNNPGERPRIISPIIFPMRGPEPLEALLAPERIVSVDLAGNGVLAKWPWVNSDAGFLVWDPENRQRVESGRQLFGSVTWWMFWRDGYAALAALDDDGNGWLEGDELAGIAIWRDINGNGVCDPGEVISLRDAGILRIAVRAIGRTSGMPFNPQGIQLTDGTFRPTYDWTPESVVAGAEYSGAKPGRLSETVPLSAPTEHIR
jgi:hypothetical protein